VLPPQPPSYPLPPPLPPPHSAATLDQPHTIQLHPSSQPQHGQLLATDTSSPQSPPSSGASSPEHPPSSHSQSPGPKAPKDPTHSLQQPISNIAPPQEKEPDSHQLQVSISQPSTKALSGLEPKMMTLPPEPPPTANHPSNAPSSLAAVAALPSADKLQIKDDDHHHPSTDPYGQREQLSYDQKAEDSADASGKREQSSTLAGCTTTTSKIEVPPDVPDPPIGGECNEHNMGSQQHNQQIDDFPTGTTTPAVTTRLDLVYCCITVCVT